MLCAGVNTSPAPPPPDPEYSNSGTPTSATFLYLSPSSPKVLQKKVQKSAMREEEMKCSCRLGNEVSEFCFEFMKPKKVNIALFYGNMALIFLCSIFPFNLSCCIKFY